MEREEAVPHVLCLMKILIECLADKWAMLILYWLYVGPRRFSQLRRDIPGVSQKMLSQTLKRLERDGLVARTPGNESANAIEYRLTPLSQGLDDPMRALALWAQVNVPAILAAREAFDRTNPDDLPAA